MNQQHTDLELTLLRLVNSLIGEIETLKGSEEIIRTYEAKKMLGTKSNASFQRWMKDHGIRNCGRGRWRLKDIMKVLASRQGK